MPKCEVDHCVRQASHEIEVIVGTVFLCDWHCYWPERTVEACAAQKA